MRTGLFRRLAVLAVACMLALAPAPTVAADGAGSPLVTAPSDQTVSSVQAAAYGGLYPYSLGSFTDPNAAAGPWQWTVDWGDGSTSNGTVTSQGPLTSSHSYMPGAFQAQVSVTNAAGLTGVGVFAVTVADGLIAAFGPDRQSVHEGTPASFSVDFYDPLPYAPFAIHIDWGDGTTQDLSTPGPNQLLVSHTYAAADPSGGPGTIYTAAATVTDSKGRQAAASLQISVLDLAPVVTAGPISVLEGSAAQIAVGTFTDASVGPWNVGIDGGPGYHFMDVLASPGPILAPYDATWGDRTLKIMVVDRGGIMTTVSVPLTVANVAPAVGAVRIDGALVNGQPLVGGSVAAQATFTDPGTRLNQETFTCTVDYGDGSGPMAGVVSGTTCTGPGHRYMATGTVTVVVNVTDSGGATGTSQATETVGPSLAPVLAPPADQTVSSLQAAPYNGNYPYAMGSFVDPLGTAGGPWHWSVDWGDGSTTTGVATSQGSLSVPHKYLPGAYRPHYVLTNAAGWSSDAYFNATVAGDLVVGFNTYYQAATEGVATTITFAYYDPYPMLPPFAVRVSWGDGTFDDFSVNSPSGTILSRSHTYAAGDRTSPEAPITVYNVSATVTDSQGRAGSAPLPVGVADLAPVVTAPPTLIVPANDGTNQITLATFTDASVGPWTIRIDGGAGLQIQQQLAAPGPISIPYSRSMGSRWVYVYVTDRGGLTSLGILQLMVVSPVPIVTGITYTPNPAHEGGVVAVVATFDAGAGDSPHTCWVDFGDKSETEFGVVANNQCIAPWHIYLDAGLYSVTVSVMAVGVGEGSSVLNLAIVNDPPTITSVSVPAEAIAFEPVSVTAKFADPGATESYTCTVDFGNGAEPEAGSVTGSTCEAVSGYGDFGNYTVTVRISDSHGGVAEQSAPISVYFPTPFVGDVQVPNPSMAGRPVVASAIFLPTGRDETYSCAVDYGDDTGLQAGTIAGSTCEGPVHVYTQPGAPSIEIIVTGSVSGSSANSTNIVVYNPVAIVGPVSAPDSAMVRSPLAASAAYISTGQDPADTCTVDYGDGTGPLAATADGAVCTGPSHSYTAAGTFTIKVTVLAANGRAASSSTTIKVYSLAVGAISVSGTATEGSSVTASAGFTPTGSQTYKCKVDYGDGSGAQNGTISGSTCKGPSHKYGRPGSFQITVTVTGTKGNTGSSIRTLDVANVMPVVTASLPSTGKIGSSVTVTASFTDPGTTETYQVFVDWGDGLRIPIQLGCGRSFSASHVYKTAGDYPVVVEVSDDQMAHVATAVPVIAIYDPARSMSGSGTFASPAGACTLSSKCAVTSTATFSLSAAYPKGATKPTATFTFSATGISFTATSADWYMVTEGVGILSGSGKLNGVSGYRFSVFAVDGAPDKILVNIIGLDSFSVYYNNDYTPLKTGSIVLK